MSGLIPKKNKKQAQLTVSSGKKRQRKTAAVSVNIIDGAWFCLGASSEDLFGVLGAVVRGDTGEAEVLLLLPGVPVAHLSLHVEAHHQLVDDHANDGAQERGKSGHQEPAISNSGTSNGKKKPDCNTVILCFLVLF